MTAFLAASWSWTKKIAKKPPVQISLGAGISYLAILIVLLIREMHGVGTEAPGDTLTEVTTWLSWKLPWVGAIAMGFLTWLWVHFARRILPVFWRMFADD